MPPADAGLEARLQAMEVGAGKPEHSASVAAHEQHRKEIAFLRQELAKVEGSRGNGGADGQVAVLQAELRAAKAGAEKVRWGLQRRMAEAGLLGG